MEDTQIIIPHGWTYFAHRTNTEKWEIDPFEEKSITLKRIMSVVTEREIYQEIEDYGIDHTLGFSSGKGEPFEIRCLICQLPYLRSMYDSMDIKNIMLKEFYFDRRNFGGMSGQRHHSIPEGEELVVLGIGEYDEAYDKEKKIIWTIPKRFIEFYKTEVERYQSRGISLKSPNPVNKKTK